jgi:peptidoglycan/LPS O-acetylase OafA/YrhL
MFGAEALTRSPQVENSPKVAAAESHLGDSQYSQLDLLRAFAVLSVFVGHFLAVSPINWNPGVFPKFGVVIFFVHTALVLMFSLRRLDRDGGGHETLRFYIRRIFRIYPLSIVCVLLVVAAHTPRWPPAGVVETATPPVLIANLLLVQNLIPLPSVTAPLWSLPFEIQMYLVLPLCYFVVEKLRRSPLYLYAAAVLLMALPSAWLHLVLPYVPCFLGGVAAYVLSKNMRPRYGWKSLLVLLIVSCAIYGYAGNWLLSAVALRHAAWGARMEIVWNWIFATEIGLLIGFFGEVKCHFVRRASYEIAKYSYGIYLSHLPIMWLAFDRMAAYPRALQWTTFAVLSCLMPLAAYHLIESPLIRVGGVVANRFRTPLRNAAIS